MKAQIKTFDRKFGKDFLAGLPASPGVYSIFAESGELIYIGKSRNLRRRLGQYRNARRRKGDRKMKVIVADAAKISWEICTTDLEACLKEISLIQTHRPKWNRAGAFSFLYPFIGIRFEPKEVYFCLTTAMEPFPRYQFYGAYRSRDIAGTAFFELMRLLKFVAHRMSPNTRKVKKEHYASYVFGYRQFPSSLRNCWDSYFRGESPEAMQLLFGRLLEHAGARAKAEEVQEGIRALKRFYKHEARRLGEAIRETGHVSYPVLQRERDPLFLRFRGTQIEKGGL